VPDTGISRVLKRKDIFRFLYDGYFMSYSLTIHGNPFRYTASGDCERVFPIRGKTVEAISFEVPQVFVPDPIHIHILQAVSDKQGCHIGHVVQQLLPTHGESGVRSSIRILLSQRFLDGGKSSSEIVLRLTSKGRVLLQKASAD
jgi:hypothetical protein